MVLFTIYWIDSLQINIQFCDIIGKILTHLGHHGKKKKSAPFLPILQVPVFQCLIKLKHVNSSENLSLGKMTDLHWLLY